MTDVITITNVGNVAENNIALASTTSSGLTLTGLQTASLDIGQSADGNRHPDAGRLDAAQ